jgi:hypothetical protein
VHHDARIIVMVVSIPPNVAALVDDEHFFVATGRQALGQNATGKAGSHNEIVEHEKGPEKGLKMSNF